MTLIGTIVTVAVFTIGLVCINYYDELKSKAEMDELRLRLLKIHEAVNINSALVSNLIEKRGKEKDSKPATIVPEDMCEEKKEEHPLEDCILYLYMREKQREEEEKKQEDFLKIVTTDTSMPPMTVHLNAGHYGGAKSYTNGDAIMDIFRNSGMDVRPNSCPNCTHEIESKDAIFCSHCGKRLRKE